MQHISILHSNPTQTFRIDNHIPTGLIDSFSIRTKIRFLRVDGTLDSKLNTTKNVRKYLINNTSISQSNITYNII